MRNVRASKKRDDQLRADVDNLRDRVQALEHRLFGEDQTNGTNAELSGRLQRLETRVEQLEDVNAATSGDTDQ